MNSDEFFLFFSRSIIRYEKRKILIFFLELLERIINNKKNECWNLPLIYPWLSLGNFPPRHARAGETEKENKIQKLVTDSFIIAYIFRAAVQYRTKNGLPPSKASKVYAPQAKEKSNLKSTTPKTSDVQPVA